MKIEKIAFALTAVPLLLSFLMLPLGVLAVSQDQSPEEAEVEIGQIYLAETYKDWNKLCTKTQSQDDPCYIYQLILTENDHPTAEVSLFRVENKEGISAAATILTPLKTLLTSKLILSLDEGTSSDYPFSWCDQRGCYVNIALSDDDVYSMKKGRSGSIQIKSISAPGELVTLPISFSGFTAAFSSLQK